MVLDAQIEIVHGGHLHFGLSEQLEQLFDNERLVGNQHGQIVTVNALLFALYVALD